VLLRLTVLLALGVGLEAAAEPLDPARATGQYAIDAWNVEQGLPASTVNTLLQDRVGYLWLGTYEGLVRFDGLQSTLFHSGNTEGLRGDGIRALAQDGDGRLWVGSNGGGLSVYEGGAFRHLDVGPQPVDQMVWAVTTRRAGGVWVGTNGGSVFHASLEGAREHARLPEVHAIFSLHEDEEGVLWAGTQGDGLWSLHPNGAWRQHEGIPHHDVRVVKGDGRRGLLVGTIGGGFAHARADGTWRRLDRAGGLPSDAVYDVTVDGRGTLWIATTGGLARVRDQEVHTLGRAEGLPDDVVYAVMADAEGNLWTGTNAGGIARIRNGAFVPYGPGDGLADEVTYAVLEDRDGKVLVGTRRGLDRLEGGRFRPLTREGAGPCGSEVRALAQDEGGGLWIGTYGGGACHLEPGRRRHFGRDDGLGSDTVRAVLPARDGTVWVGTVQGLSRLGKADTRWTNLTTRDGLPHDSVMCLLEDHQGVLWIGTSGGGLVRRVGDRFEPLGVGEGLASSVVFDLQEDGDTLWVGTNAGISRVRGGKVRSITTRHGLPVGSINQIVDDGAGSLWVGSGRGIVRVAKSELHAVADGTQDKVAATLFDRGDGLRSGQSTVPVQPAGQRTRDGRLWFSTMRGLAVIEPTRMPRDPVPPGVAIERVTVDDAQVGLGGGLRLGPGPDRVAIEYAGLCTTNPARVRFRYRLEGHDAEWIDAGTARAAHYTRLGPGDYRFRVQAMNADGVWNLEGASLGLRVAPTWWQTGWARALAVLAILGLGFGLHRLRTRVLEARGAELGRLVEESSREAERRRRAAEEASLQKTEILGLAAHDLKNPLTTILGLLELLQMDPPADARKAEYLAGIGRSAEKMRALLDDLLSTAALETGHIELQMERLDGRALLDAVARDLARSAQRKDQKILVSGDHLPVQADEMRLLQALENLVSNALKFSPAGSAVRVDLERHGDEVRFRVRDEGPGLTAEDQAGLFKKFTRLSARPTANEPSTGLGLSIVKRLVELHGGRTWAESEGPGRGATFFVELPAADRPPRRALAS
jgi:signal transduction histidine kinase/ligand-binding sensor domain-containing protein